MEPMVGEPLTWRRLLTRRTLRKPPAADLIPGGGRGSSFAVSRRSMPYLRMEMQVGSFAPAKAYPQPGGFPRGTFPPFHPRGSLVCVGVAAGCDSRLGLPPPRFGGRGGAGRGGDCRRGRFSFLRVQSGGAQSMHWDRRFAIVVSLIWALLVSGAFFLLAGIHTPASPTSASAENPRVNATGQIEY